MGHSFSQFWNHIFGPYEVRILLLGLDGAGKTTILYRLKTGEVLASIPTIGFNVETVEYKNILLTVWDVGGQEALRPLWRHYYRRAKAVIFVIDCNDVERIEMAGGELFRVLDDDDLKNVKVLVYANKQDLPSSMKGSVMANKLGLHKRLSHRVRWYVQDCCATTGEGIHEGLNWLSAAITLK